MNFAPSGAMMTDCLIEAFDQDRKIDLTLNGGRPGFLLRTEAIAAAAVRDLDPIALDLLDIAATVFFADGAVPRGGDVRGNMGRAWYRNLRLTIPVRCPAVWQRAEVQDALAAAIGFLTDDRIEFHFPTSSGATHGSGFLALDPSGATFRADEVILFSGGLDSFAGALETLSTGRGNVLLVSHRSAPKVHDRQKTLAGYLIERFPGRIRHVVVEATRVGGEAIEPTQRSRSFLFAAIGTAVAQTFGATRLKFFENGIVSHNLPISPQVTGTMATRTTHPKSLALLSKMISLVLPDAPQISNDYEWLTKTEVVERIRRYGGERMIGGAVSCTRVRGQTLLHTHCGECSQCHDRRFAILAAGLDAFDPDESYATDVLLGANDQPDARTMAVEWTRHALLINNLTELNFVKQFGTEISRLLEGYSGNPQEEIFSRIFDLHRRQAKIVLAVLTQAIQRHASELAAGRLSATSLLVLHVGAARGEPSALAVETAKDIGIEPTIDQERYDDDYLDPVSPPGLIFSNGPRGVCVAVRGLCDLTGNAAKVTELLKTELEADRTNGVAPQDGRFVHIAALPSCKMSKDIVRAALTRCRGKVASAFRQLHGLDAPSGFLIQTKPTHGHRLNPQSRIRTESDV
jgi:hypothetical protein